VVQEVGADAVRFFLVSRSADAMMDFDLDLAKEQSNKNPVYYVQYAHARSASILRRAGELGVPLTSAEGDTSLLTHDAELALIRKMLRLPEVVEAAAISLAPHSLPYYAMELATSLHAFYDTDECRVLPRDPTNPSELALSRARLKLVAACQIVLANTLALIGVRTPEQM